MDGSSVRSTCPQRRRAGASRSSTGGAGKGAQRASTSARSAALRQTENTPLLRPTARGGGQPARPGCRCGPISGRDGNGFIITERPYLYFAEWSAAGDVVIAAPNDALPLVSLYLRAQDRFHVRRAHAGKPGANINLTRGAFYLTATHELLPTVWRWIGACEQYAQATNDESLLYLAAAAFRRVSGALQARDHVHFA